MLTKVLTLVLVVLIGLLGVETARYVHGAGDASTGMVNIHLVVFAGVLLAVLWLSRAWLARQWTLFSVWFELTLDGLLDFNSLDVGDGLGSISGSTSSALSESLRGLRLMKLYDLRFGAGSAGELRREMDALHRHTDGSLNWQASNAAIIASMERRLAEVPSQRDALIIDLLSQGFAASERDITVRIGGPGELIIECRAELVDPIRRAAHDRFPVGTLLTFKEQP